MTKSDFKNSVYVAVAEKMRRHPHLRYGQVVSIYINTTYGTEIDQKATAVSDCWESGSDDSGTVEKYLDAAFDLL